MSNRIEEIIDDIEEYIDTCKYQPLSNSKIIVNKEEIDELIAELRMRVPDEIKKYQKIVNQQDAILKDAQRQAQEVGDREQDDDVGDDQQDFQPGVAPVHRGVAGEVLADGDVFQHVASPPPFFFARAAWMVLTA